MTRLSILLIIPALIFSSSLTAGGQEDRQLQHKQEKAEYQAMLEEAERARIDAEAMRLKALKASEMARETAARARAERARSQSERNRADTEEHAREQALEQKELIQAREELGRAHRELREATREVARAHRDLSHVNRVHEIITHVNLGDRAVIGVVLGGETEKGVEIIGISPDGPAERAGLQQGDTLASIRGVELAGNDGAREAVFEVMSEANDGEELAVVVDRDGESWEYTVIAETREPRGWQSVIRIPEVEVVEEVSGVEPVIVERIVVPDIDEVALAERVAELSARVSADVSTRMGDNNYEFVIADGDRVEHIEFESFSELGGEAMREANIWFGLPHAHGLELATVNADLGAYFKTDRGVLVISAKEDNAYQLETGDVILSINSTEVNSPSDMMRALRDADPGQEIELNIKRERRDRKLSVTMPENRLGFK